MCLCACLTALLTRIMRAKLQVGCWSQARCNSALHMTRLVLRPCAAPQELQGQREQLQEQLAAVKATMAEVEQRVAQAQQEHKTAQQTAAERLQALQQVLRRPSLQPPSSVAEARQVLAQVQQQAAEEQQRCALPLSKKGARAWAASVKQQSLHHRAKTRTQLSPCLLLRALL